MMLKPILVPALAVQLFHALLCIIWNLIGVWQLSKGLPAIGPTASIAAIGIILVLSGLLIEGVRSKHVALYLGVSGLMFLAAVCCVLAVRGLALCWHHSERDWPSWFWLSIRLYKAIKKLIALCFKDRKHG